LAAGADKGDEKPQRLIIMAKTSVLSSVHINVRGVVQGVGFRPFVYQLATKYDLNGWVCNTSEDVKIEIEGEAEAIEQFLLALQNQAPPRAYIEGISTTHYPPANYDNFEIRHSIAKEGKYQLISPDIATCQDCLKEILTPSDRRYRYPFTNCTNCGPRFTIIKDIPYDRPLTTMNRFKMCPECQREYDDPLNRRFHAQPNACPKCGPTLELVDNQGNPVDGADAIAIASQFLREGRIVAIKGLGGFLLACDATNQAVVNLLRRRKMRPSKPLAIMVSSIEEVKKHCHVSDEEEKLLTSPHSPIVLLKWKASSSVSSAVAPNLKYLGVMLPYTPLHHILLRETGLPLVMTSGNLSEEPIAKDNDEAIRRLKGIADYFLMHNRDIYARYDDSVTVVEREVTQLIRRARGYAPYPIHLPFKSQQILACGAEEKNTFCLTRDDHAFLSQHTGDMENLETMEHFENTISLYKSLFRIEPTIIAHDLHPEYLATKYAKELAAKSDIKLVPVQHHHAHIVSGMVYRIAIGYILSLLGEVALRPDLPFLKQVDSVEIDIIRKQIEKRINSPLTSSCGRLFDAVSALIGVRGTIDYEAQAAIELEMLAHDRADETNYYPFSIIEQNGLSVVKLQDLLAAIIHDLQIHTAKATMAAKFHNTIAQMIEKLCQVISDKTGITQVVLSGGVFQNRLLLRKAVSLLEADGFTVFTHQQVPCNDGGISLGQAVIANFANK